jgi:hypothetical protein
MTASIAERRVLALRADLKRPPRPRERVAAAPALREHPEEIGLLALGLEPEAAETVQIGDGRDDHDSVGGAGGC